MDGYEHPTARIPDQRPAGAGPGGGTGSQGMDRYLHHAWMLDLDEDDRARFLGELLDVTRSAAMEGTLLDVSHLLTRWAERADSLVG